MKTLNVLSLICSILFANFGISQEIMVSNVTEYNAAILKVNSGGIIVLKNGEWKNVNLLAHGNGTKNIPIIIKAETAGQVILSGNSSLSIYGNHIIVSGLWFKGGKTSSKFVVQFRKNSKEFANNCRFTNSTISYFGTADESIKNHWVDLWGKNNRVDHNNFTGKASSGTTLVVWLKGKKHIENNHKIDNNLFGTRPELGKNGGETIRIGTSTNSKKSSKTLVERNVFAGCDGEIEIISNKSGDNIFRDNLFVGSKGALTLRHGDNALVERNVFLGNGVSKTGGIRVINSGHIIRNNLMIGLQGDGYRGPIVLMNGVPNSPLNRYEQVRNVDIQNNTIINSGPISFGEGKDDEKSLAPKNVNFSNNLVYNNKASRNIIFIDEASDINFNTNYIDALGTSEQGFKATKVNWKEIQTFPIPTAVNTDLLIASKNNKSPQEDISRAVRKTYNVGAYNLGSKKLPKALNLRAGPGWKPNIITPIIKPYEITVEPGLETLRRAVDKAPSGSIINLKTGKYILEKKIKLTKNITIIGDKGGTSILIIKKDVENSLDYFFRVNEGNKFILKNVIIDGENSKPKYAIVSPDKKENILYSVFVDNVIFKNFKNTDGGSVFKAYTGTKADTLSFKNSKFENNYRGLSLAYDKDNIGIYNANIIQIENTVFEDIEEFAINFVRTTPNIEIHGGKLVIKNCVFSNVYNTEKGKVLRVNGIHSVQITNAVFVNSYKIKNPISLQGSASFIKNSLFYDSGFPKVSKNAKEMDLIYKNPKWEDDDLFIPSNKSPLLKENNDIEIIGLRQ